MGDTMEIEDAGEVTRFDPMPTEQTLYLSAVRYSGGVWMGGPYGRTREEVYQSLQNWKGIDSARVYAVKVPVDALAP